MWLEAFAVYESRALPGSNNVLGTSVSPHGRQCHLGGVGCVHDSLGILHGHCW